MMIYDVEISEQAEVDLRNLYIYIAEELQSPESADGQLERIEEAIYKLDKFPERFRLYYEEPWKSKGVRILIVDNYVALYVVEDEKGQVTVIRVMYGGRDIEVQLEISLGKD
jgi:toxin ParE1/3/4